MARMKHPKGDLEMTIDGVDINGDTMIINGKMGVWSAQIHFEPSDIAVMARHFLSWKTLQYFIYLPFRMMKSGYKKQA